MLVIIMTLPYRKPTRMTCYDYDTSGYYFVTICTKDKECLFSHLVKGDVILHPIGIIVKKHILSLGKHYNNVFVDKYVIMPNHIHMIIVIYNDSNHHTNLSNVIGLLKSGISREVNKSIWQRSYYDHIIRNQKDYEEIWKYIDNNPMNWSFS